MHEWKHCDVVAEQKWESGMKRIAGKMQASYISIKNLTVSSVLEAVLTCPSAPPQQKAGETGH
jgi:hypothetical protein